MITNSSWQNKHKRHISIWLSSYFRLSPQSQEAVVHRCYVKKVFLEISQNSQ